MNVFIEKQEWIDITFIKWLIRELKTEILSAVDVNRFEKLTAHSSEIFNQEINMISAFIMIVDSITFYELSNKYVIEIPSTVYFNDIPLKHLYNYLTFGNMQIKGYPIIYNILSKVTLKLKVYKLRYDLIGVI